MGQVVPFIARVRDSGDWSATERARLQDLANRLAAGGVHVEVIFGATDEGDPWCVVTDADGDVLIHVARIDGKFVVHSAVDDAVNENVDLHAALRGSLDATEDALAPHSATILPFGLTARQGQTFLALLAATAFFYETSAVGDTAEASEPVHLLPPDEPPPPPPEADSPTQERENAQGVALQPTDQGPAPMLVDAPAPAAAAREPHDDAPPPIVATPNLAPAPKGEMALGTPSPAGPALTIRGTAGDDLLVGTSADEHLVGGDGNDTLRGGGGHDLLEGGAGDDVLEVTGQVTAVGGAGADTFVIQAPVQLGHADTLLGVILDFSAGEGDRLLNWTGTAIRLPPHGGETDKQAPPTTDGSDFTGQVTPNPPPTTDPQPDPDTTSGGGTFGPTLIGPTVPLTRVDVDLDGDGVVDGYLLFGVRGHLVEPPITATVGAGFGPADPVG